MKSLCVYVCLIAACVTAAVADVSVSSPASGANAQFPGEFRRHGEYDDLLEGRRLHGCLHR
jgi:hypothetical protein